MLGRVQNDLATVAWVRRALRTGAARSIREASGTTLGELARAIEVSPSAVSRWERGIRTPRPDDAERMAGALKALMSESA